MFFSYFWQKVFIGLIHPTQWTIANLVSADQPAKQQKSRPVSPPASRSNTVYSPGGASYFLPV